MRRGFVAIGSLALVACGQANEGPAAPDAAPTPVPIASTSGPPAPPSFAQCGTCHRVAPGQHAIGPSLAGIHGAKAGSAEGYAFSAAMQGSGLTWDDATLDRFLETPMATVTGTKMVYPGVKDPAKRAAVIAYLKTL